jgi:5'-nucleotidase
VRYYRDVFHPRVDPRGRRYYWLAGEVRHGEEEGTDIAAVEKNMISITPIHLRITDESLFPSLEELVGELKRVLEE